MRILSFELGSWSLKAIEMESSFRRVEIVDLHEIRLPLQNSNPTENFRKSVEQLVARLPHHPEKVVTSLPAAQTALRFLQMPLKQRKKVEQSFRFELEDNIPFKLEDALLEHHTTLTKEGATVFAAIAPKKNVQGYLDWLKSIQVDPDWLTFEGMGVVNLYLSRLAEKDVELPPEPTLLLDLGHQKTNVSILRDKHLTFFRSINWGGFAITQTLAMSLGLSLEAAEEKKHTGVDLSLDEEEVTNAGAEKEDLITLTAQALSPLLTDLSHSLVAFRSAYKLEVASIVLTGGTANLEGIDKFLSQALHLPVRNFKPFKEMNFGKEVDPSQEMRFGEPLGRALVFTRKSELLFNFRKQELAKTTSLTQMGTFLKNPVTVQLLKYAAVLAVILFIHSFISGFVALNESDKSGEELKKVFSDTFRTVPAKARTGLINDPDDLKKFIDKKEKELAGRLSLLSKGRTTRMDLLRQISDAIPSDTKVDVNILNLESRSFRIEGVLYKGSVQSVVDGLKKVTAFNNIRPSSEGQRFIIEGEIAGR